MALAMAPQAAPPWPTTLRVVCWRLVLVLVMGACGGVASKAGPSSLLPAPSELQVELLPVPVLGLSERAPRFSWVAEVPAGVRGLSQVAYRVTVAGTDQTELVAWDSGRVDSAVSYGIEYAGTPLEANAAYVWTAQWWGSDGARSATSVGHFDMGPMTEADWHGAEWLSALNSSTTTDRLLERAQFRADFTVPANASVTWARAHVAAPGCHHIEVNGHAPALDRMGVCVFREPSKTVMWQTHDITPLVKPGANAVGLLAGHVLQSHPAFSRATPYLRAILVVRLSDSTSVVVVTTPDAWQSRRSYVLRDSMYSGTAMDWRQVEAGWSTPAFTATAAWSPATWVAPAPAGVLRREAVPAAAALGVVKPIAVRRLDSGNFLYSFPSNFVGVVRVNPLPSAPDGATLTITHGEFLARSPSPPGPSPPWPGPPAPAVIPDKRFINANNLGLWFMSAGTRHHVTTQEECGVNLFQPRPWGYRVTDARMTAIPKSSIDFTCSMCNQSCFAANKPTITDPLPPSLSVSSTARRLADPLRNTFGQVDEHVLRHGNALALTPLFTWHGFQFITVQSLPSCKILQQGTQLSPECLF